MAATLVCQRCKLTTLQQQWQRCNITACTLVWQQWQTSSAVTSMFTLLWQRCAHHCEICGNWQRYHSTVNCHRWNTNVHIVTSALLLPLLSQCCHCQRCDITLLSAPSLSQRCARFRCHSAVVYRCLTAVGLLLCSKYCACVAREKPSAKSENYTATFCPSILCWTSRIITTTARPERLCKSFKLP